MSGSGTPTTGIMPITIAVLMNTERKKLVTTPRPRRRAK